MAPPPSPPGPAPAPGDADAAPTLLHEFFARAARRWPGRVAVETPPSPGRPVRRAVTYAELDRRSDAFAHALTPFVRGECIVAVLLPRTSEHVYLAQLAALKAGAAYCCIDPAFPDAHVGHILNDARPVALITDGDGAARARRVAPGIAGVIDVHEADGAASPRPRPPWLTPRSLAYVIHTSGTTGRPKGVLIEHGGIANLVRGDMATLPVHPDDRVGQNSSCAYDSSLEEVWMAFAAGATLVVMDDDTTRLGPDLVPWLRREMVTIFSPPPTLLRATGCDAPDKVLPALHRIHVGGEPLPHDVAERWSPARVLLNDYGPTECSVVALRGDSTRRADHHRPARPRHRRLGAGRGVGGGAGRRDGRAVPGRAGPRPRLPQRRRARRPASSPRTRGSAGCTAPATWPAATPTASSTATAASTRR